MSDAGVGEQPLVDEFGRPEPPASGTETEVLLGFLEYQRATFAWKTGGLDAAGLQVTVAASSMTIGGMIKHLAYVEDSWFHIRLFDAEPPAPWDAVDWDADPDWEWHSAGSDTPEQVYALWQESLARSRVAVASAMAAGGMGYLARYRFRDGRAPNLRWIVTHMIEEYARHNGHVDLIRESIDGLVGE
ncbi:MAG: DinB family protein [Propionibacteriaceae bacterium]